MGTMQIDLIDSIMFVHPSADQSPCKSPFDHFRQFSPLTLADCFRVLTEGLIEHIPSCGLGRFPWAHCLSFTEDVVRATMWLAHCEGIAKYADGWITRMPAAFIESQESTSRLSDLARVARSTSPVRSS
jgi:hypothetical protein